MPYAHSHFHYHLPRLSEMKRIYWAHGAGLLGMGATTIFVPLFLLNIGYSFRTVLVFVVGMHLAAAAVQLPIAKLFALIRPNHVMALGLAGQIVFLLILGTLEQAGWHLWIIALVWALYRTTFWAAFHYIFGASRAHRKTGLQVAGSQIIMMAASTLAPAIGGVVATVWGISYTFVFAALLIVIAILPMLKRGAGPDKVEFSLDKPELWRMRPDLTANAIGAGPITAIELTVWPLLVFALVPTYAGVGVLSSVIAGASIAIALFVGMHERAKGERHYIKQGMVAYGMTSLVRALVQNAFHVFGANLLAGIGRSLYTTPYLSRYYANSDGRFRLGYVTAMEIAFSVGSAVFLGVLLLLSFFLSMEMVLIVGVAAAAFAILGLRLIR
jgi:hypothetical protein